MPVDSSGNQKVDFAWGNVPLQPNEERTPSAQPIVVEPANSDQNRSWSGTTVYPSDALDETLDNHILVVTGHNGYPNYLPNDVDNIPGNIPIPDLEGGSEEFAIAQWVAAGFKAENVSIVYLGNDQGANAQNNGTVASQEPEAGHTADVDHVITLEVYQALLNVSLQYLVVGGGGGGGAGTSTNAPGAGGGGAGGLISGSMFAEPGMQYTITVGSSGFGGENFGNGVGTSGLGSVFGNIQVAGGGFGGAPDYQVNELNGKGSDGGSGGGGCAGANKAGYKALGNTPATVPAQGNDGGVTDGAGGGGGGGAGNQGSDGYQTGNYGNGQGGAGGAGVVSAITGQALYYAGGGGGGAYGDFGAEAGGSGGSGVGGKGAGTSGPATSGAPSSGSGGGGGGSHSSYPTYYRNGADGGSGVVVLRYPSNRTLNVYGELAVSQTTADGDKVSIFTGGTGVVIFS
jgi:hypothetical protein